MTIGKVTPITTAIGSLPHHNLDSAMALAFHTDLPSLPQIPIRNPKEYMIAQSLDGLAGLKAETDGSVTLDSDLWLAKSRELDERLLQAYSQSTLPHAFEAFEPDPSTSSSWKGFLWELEERGLKEAKIQLAGPLTSQWAIRIQNGKSPEQIPGLSTQIYRLVLARCIGMCRKLKSKGIHPTLFLDEPGLYGLNLSSPRHILGIQELKLVIQTLINEGADVGLHCCSNTKWDKILELPLSILSFDTEISLSEILKQKELLSQFIKRGGRLSFGIIPTTLSHPELRIFDNTEKVKNLIGEIKQALTRDLFVRVMQSSIWTPACGLALQTPGDADLIINLVEEARDLCISSIESTN